MEANREKGLAGGNQYFSATAMQKISVKEIKLSIQSR